MERKFVVIRCVVVSSWELTSRFAAFPTKGAHKEVPQRHEEHKENIEPKGGDA